MKNVLANARYWIAGLATAFAGVALVRLIGPSLHGPFQIAVTFAGQLLALAGLFIICLGVRRRIQRTEASGASHPSDPV